MIALYYGIAALDEDVAITQRMLEISEDRFERQEGKAALGGVGRLDVLNAQVDLQADSTTYILATQRRERSVQGPECVDGSLLRNEYASIASCGVCDAYWPRNNWCRGHERERAVGFSHSSSASGRSGPAYRQGPALAAARSQCSIRDQPIRQNEVGVVLGTYTQGFNGGLTVSVPLFNGGRINTQVEAARLRAENAVIAEQQARLQVERDVRNAYTTWSSQREVLRIQPEAVNTAQINFERTRELFQAGQLTGLQFRQAQFDLANAERQSVVSGFDTKVAELILLRASGGLTSALGIQP